MKKSLWAALVALGLAGLSSSVFAVPRTYVATAAGGGNDANTSNNCSVDYPCRKISTALGVTDAGGEVIIMLSGNYGPFSVTKSVIINAAPGIYTGVAALAGNNQSILIDGVGISVTIRGMTINGAGATDGIRVANGARLTVENCVIAGQKYVSNLGTGINVLASGVELRVINSIIRDNNYGIFIGGGGTASIANSVIAGNSTSAGGGAAIYAKGDTAGVITTVHVSDSVVTGNHWGITTYTDTATAVAKAFVTRSTVTNNEFGIDSDNSGGGASTAVFLTGNTVTDNATGLSITGSGATMTSYGNNLVTGNGTEVNGTLTTGGVLQ